MSYIPLRHLVLLNRDQELAIVIGRKMDPNFVTIRYMYGHQVAVTHTSYTIDLGSLYTMSIPFRSYSSTVECLHHHPELLL